MKELLIKLNTYAYYHRKTMLILFGLSLPIVWFASAAMWRALPPIGDLVAIGIITVVAIAYVVYIMKHRTELDARITKV